MSAVQVSSHNLPADVQSPASKSYANRALAVAAVSPSSFTLKNMPQGDDVHYMIEGLRALGVHIRKKGSSVKVGELGAQKESSVYLGEGGTTIRFCIAVAAALGREIAFEAHPDFFKRPLSRYQEVLEKAGSRLVRRGNALEVSGRLRPGVLEVDCSKTTQFASALELVADIAKIQIIPINLNSSSKYLYMTSYVKQALKRNKKYSIPTDFSSLSYFAAYAALTEKTKVTNSFGLDPFQADAKIIEILNKLGADVHFSSKGLEIAPIKTFYAIEVDVSLCLDIAPTLAFLFAYSGKRQVMKNLKNLRHKESDRLKGILELLSAFHIQHSYNEEDDVLVIEGGAPSKGLAEIEVARDHRMVMAASLFLKLNGGGTISPADAVAKSFPDFFLWFS